MCYHDVGQGEMKKCYHDVGQGEVKTCVTMMLGRVR